MAETGFKHISVTPAEDDDFVIRAGVGSASGATVGQEPELAVESELEPEPTVEPEVEREPEPEEKPKPKPARGSAPKPKKADAYSETTLEDLNSTKMPLAQKIVIIAAIVCIIGAVIYYFAFLR